jgi:hypothetical protein
MGSPWAPAVGFAGGLQPLSGGVPLCPELLALFKALAEAAAAAARNTRAGKGRPEEPSSPEVNNSTGVPDRLSGGRGGAFESSSLTIGHAKTPPPCV